MKKSIFNPISLLLLFSFLSQSAYSDDGCSNKPDFDSYYKCSRNGLKPVTQVEHLQEGVPSRDIQNSSEELCKSYGLFKGSAAFANCMIKLREQDITLNKESELRQKSEVQEKRNAQNNWDVEYQRCISAINKLPPTVSSNYLYLLGECKKDPSSWRQLPQQTYCKSYGNGELVCETQR